MRARQSFAAAPRPGLQAVRAVLATVEVACFSWAVAYLPLADVMAFYLAGPISSRLAATFLARDGRLAAMDGGGRRFCRRVSACAPAGDPSWPAGLALPAHHLRDIPHRHPRAPRHARYRDGTTWPTARADFRSRATPLGWVPSSLFDVVLLALLGIVAMRRILCVNRSLKIAPASAVVPYQYTPSSGRCCSATLLRRCPGAGNAHRCCHHRCRRPVHLPPRTPARPARAGVLAAAAVMLSACRRPHAPAPAGCSADRECLAFGMRLHGLEQALRQPHVDRLVLRSGIRTSSATNFQHANSRKGLAKKFRLPHRFERKFLFIPSISRRACTAH